jgi:hypothetical protein
VVGRFGHAPARSPRRDREFPESSRRGTADAERLIMLMIILIVLLVLALGGGAWGYGRYGYGGFSPAGILLIGLVVLWMLGYLR